MMSQLPGFTGYPGLPERSAKVAIIRISKGIFIARHAEDRSDS